jgi:hypothetical protein
MFNIEQATVMMICALLERVLKSCGYPQIGKLLN